MNDFKIIITSPLFLIPGVIGSIATYLISARLISEEDKHLAYIYAAIFIFIIVFVYYVYFNWKKAEEIYSLKAELNELKKLIEQADASTKNSDTKLKKNIKFSKQSIRNVRLSCDMMHISLGNLNTHKNKKNEEDIRNVIIRYEEIKIAIDNLEDNLDE